MRIPMKRFALNMTAMLLSASAFALGTVDLLESPGAKDVLGKKCIRLGTSEVLPIDFQTACRVLERSKLVEAVQEEFVRSVSGNGKADFPIAGTGQGKYHYINEKGQRTDITELYRQQTDDYSFDYVVHASGKRFFGHYDIIIHLQVVDADPSGVIYSVIIHAYPHNGITRFSARKLAPAKKYFRKKMKLISYVAREVGLELCEKEEFQPDWSGGSHFPATGR
ncbi:MAG: hypothetical protein U9P12_05875 [Verrucomicrobiota bacterium]|nr:hypothetical protein [Verrucomicrobiota bacterium]